MLINIQQLCDLKTYISLPPQRHYISLRSEAVAASENHHPPGFFVITLAEKPAMLQIPENLLILETVSFFITCFKSKGNAY